MNSYLIKHRLRHDGRRYEPSDDPLRAVSFDDATAAPLLACGAIELLPTKADIDTMLVGSSTLPSTFALADGGELPLGDAVRAAFKASGLSVEEWNALAEDVADRQIAAHALLLGAVGAGRQNPIQPSAESADGLSADGAEAGAPASAPEACSTTDAQTDVVSSESSPSGEAPPATDAAVTTTTSEGDAGAEAPAIVPAPLASDAASLKSDEPSGDGAASPEAPAATPAPKDAKPAAKNKKR